VSLRRNALLGVGLRWLCSCVPAFLRSNYLKPGPWWFIRVVSLRVSHLSPEPFYDTDTVILNNCQVGVEIVGPGLL